MDDYDKIYTDWAVHVLYSSYQPQGVTIVAKGTGLADAPMVASNAATPGANGTSGGSGGAMVPASALPSGFRRLSDLRKRPAKQTYEDLKQWVGKTIRLDGVNFQTKQDGEKLVIVSGTMTFSEFDPTNPDREVADSETVTTAIPRGAIRALYEGIKANPDETIVCDVTQGKRGLALQ